MSDFLVWNAVVGNAFALLENIGTFQVDNSVEYAAHREEKKFSAWPTEAIMRMNPQFKKNNMLADAMKSLCSAVVVSEKLKNFIQNEIGDFAEYLPVTILDHSGNIASSSYFIIHFPKHLDCIDFQKTSGIVWAPDNAFITTCDELVIDEGRLSPEDKLFRMKKEWKHILIRREIAEKIKAQNFTGLKFREIENEEW